MIVLQNRLLQADGTNIVEPDVVEDLILSGVSPNKILTTEMTEDIELFNSMSDIPVLVYDENDTLVLDFDYQIPQDYKDIDLIEFFSQFITEENVERIAQEIEYVYTLNIIDEIRTIIYVVDVLDMKKVVWGVGRGSSCASYLLFLIGLHCVDCIKYDIPCEEFFHL